MAKADTSTVRSVRIPNIVDDILRENEIAISPLVEEKLLRYLRTIVPLRTLHECEAAFQEIRRRKPRATSKKNRPSTTPGRRSNS